jgi:hypothetical protein
MIAGKTCQRILGTCGSIGSMIHPQKLGNQWDDWNYPCYDEGRMFPKLLIPFWSKCDARL